MAEMSRMTRMRILVLLLTTYMIALTITIACASPPVETLSPNEDIHADWYPYGTPLAHHYDRLLTNDGDTSCLYSSSGVPTYYDSFGLPDISSGYTIDSVTVWVVARAWFGSDQNIRILIKTHDTFYPALDFYDPDNTYGTQTHLTGSYAAYSKTYLNNPHTNSPWTTNEVNDLQVGIQNSYGANYEEPTVTQLYVEVNESPPLPIPYAPFGVTAALGCMMLTFGVVMLFKRSRTSSPP